MMLSNWGTEFCQTGALSSYVIIFGKLISGYEIGKGQFSLQHQRRVTPKDVQTSMHFGSFHMLDR